MLDAVTKELFFLGFLVLKERLNKMKYFFPFEKFKTPTLLAHRNGFRFCKILFSKMPHVVQ